MAKGSPVKGYAKDLILELQGEIDSNAAVKLPPVETIVCIQQKPLQFRSTRNGSLFDKEDLHWTVSPKSILVGHFLSIVRTHKNETPIVVGILDEAGPDFTHHPKGKQLFEQFAKLRSQVGSWKAPVLTRAQLPREGNGHGDVRLVTTERAMYAWGAGSGIWYKISSENLGGTGVDATKLPLAGGTLLGDLIMSSGTSITIPDAPAVGTDAANKDYVDNAVSSVVSGTETVSVSTTNSSATLGNGDRVVLVTGSVTISLPSSPLAGQLHTIKDDAGTATSGNITIDGNGKNIDGAATYTMDINYEAVTVVYHSTHWRVI